MNDVIRQPGGDEYFFLVLPYDVPGCRGYLSLVCTSESQHKRASEDGDLCVPPFSILAR
ncbi:hypothetical protein BDM02DRAFT_2050999 [Thelephora ganbajun]|uniref:Uncharacterized protein n=1 Tax=Thelephora ganbajun TaxID=370292 RepID=A0ACB6YZI3_THEGA|nr:hypothetical protein BDM02DRAFT_2050999 [Thelephora ganbajun]